MNDLTLIFLAVLATLCTLASIVVVCAGAAASESRNEKWGRK